MARLSKKKSLAVVAGVGALAVTGGVAFAYWTTTTSADSNAPAATAATAGNWSVAVTKGESVDLYPTVTSAPAQGFTYTVANNTNGSLGLGSVSVALTVTQASNASGTCTAADYDVFGITGGTTGSVNAGGDTVTYTSPVNVNAGASAPGGSFSVKLVNDPERNQDGCKGATVKATVTVG